MDSLVKALYMVAGVLIGIMIITLMMYAIREGAELNMTYDSSFYQKNVARFNSKIEGFITKNHNRALILTGNRNSYDNLLYSSADEVISVVNLAYNYNKEAEDDVTNQIIVEIYNTSGSRKYWVEVKASGNDLKQGCLYTSGSNQMEYADFIKEYGKNFIEPNAKALIIGKGLATESSEDMQAIRTQNNYIYEYLFRGEFEYDEGRATTDNGSGKINKIKFYMVENKLYDMVENARTP